MFPRCDDLTVRGLDIPGCGAVIEMRLFLSGGYGLRFSTHYMHSEFSKENGENIVFRFYLTLGDHLFSFYFSSTHSNDVLKCFFPGPFIFQMPSLQ